MIRLWYRNLNQTLCRITFTDSGFTSNLDQLVVVILASWPSPSAWIGTRNIKESQNDIVEVVSRGQRWYGDFRQCAKVDFARAERSQ